MKTKTVNVSGYITRDGRQVETHRRRKPGTAARTVATTMMRPAIRSMALADLLADAQAATLPVPVPHVVEAPKPAADPVLVIPLAVLSVLAALVAIGAYVVLYGVLEPMYHGAGAALRALVPLAVEMIAGYAVHHLIGAKRMVLAGAAALVILGCAGTEIDAATTAPEVAKRERMEHVLSQPAKAEDVKGQQVQGEHGKKGALQAEQNEGARLTLQAGREAAAQDRQQKLEANAAESPAGEGRLALELAILGAIGSSCLLPLLEALLIARRDYK